ncbi:MAG: hypothetical protein M5U08_16735 [Burkholderiales bacterium]|nr:hypothetical protein [Burkholderiales bacterium]
MVDEELYQQIHILDAEQGAHLAAILAESVESRARELQALNGRDFYFERYFKPGESKSRDASGTQSES